MNTDEDTGPDIHRLLEAAGAEWRSRQVLGPVVVSPDALESGRASRSVAAMLARATGTIAVVAMVLAVLVLALQLEPRPGVGSDEQPSSVMPATPPPVSASPSSFSATPPADVEAIQDRVIEAVNADWANFGGVYLEKDGTLVIQYIGANAGRAAVEEALEPGVSVRWQEVERSRADLMGMKREIRDRNLDGVVGVGIDTINNQVEVTVSPSEHFEEVSQILGSEYGDAVEVVTGPPIVVHPERPSPSPTE